VGYKTISESIYRTLLTECDRRNGHGASDAITGHSRGVWRRVAPEEQSHGRFDGEGLPRRRVAQSERLQRCVLSACCYSCSHCCGARIGRGIKIQQKRRLYCTLPHSVDNKRLLTSVLNSTTAPEVDRPSNTHLRKRTRTIVSSRQTYAF
jgi:hypothetical protein